MAIVKFTNYDHGNLTGLADDDHTQYFKADGTRNLTGNLIQNAGLYIATSEVRARDASGLKLYNNAGAYGIFIDDDGNVGIGNTSLKPWYATLSVLQLGGNASIMSTSPVLADASFYMMQNVYHDGAFKRISTAEYSYIRQALGEIRFFTDASGTADTAFTPSRRMTIDKYGNVGINTTPSEKLHVNGNVRIETTNYYYFGDSATDGSWRTGIVGGNFVIQKRVSGAWTTKGTFL